MHFAASRATCTHIALACTTAARLRVIPTKYSKILNYTQYAQSKWARLLLVSPQYLPFSASLLSALVSSLYECSSAGSPGYYSNLPLHYSPHMSNNFPGLINPANPVPNPVSRSNFEAPDHHAATEKARSILGWLHWRRFGSCGYLSCASENLHL